MVGAAFAMIAASCTSGAADPGDNAAASIASVPLASVPIVNSAGVVSSGAVPLSEPPVTRGSLMTTTVPGPVNPDAAAVGDLVALGASCAAPTGVVASAGEVTFVAAGRVFLVTPGSQVAMCAYDLGGTPINRLAWSPDSTAVLLGSARVVRASSMTESGYLPANADVNWSGPKGTSLLATTATGGLVKRDSRTAARTDLTFLPKHLASVYHPAGKAIVSIGETPDPEVVGAEVGVYISSNSGGDSRLLVADESGAHLSEPAFSGSGELLYFLARHTGSSSGQGQGRSHVHEFDTRVGSIDVMLDVDGPLAQLTASAVDDSVAVRVGGCDGALPTDVQFITDRAGPFESLRSRVPGLDSGWLSPVGWLPGKRLAVLIRNAGCDGAGSLAVVDLETARTQTIAKNVSIAATRTVHEIPEELAIPIGLEAAA